MSKLLINPPKQTGRIAHVTPQSAGWSYVGFDLHHLAQGDSAADASGDNEVCLVLIQGKGGFVVNGADLGELGERMTPFEGAPYSVYMPKDSDWRVEATTDLVLGVCAAPAGSGEHPVRVIGPDACGKETRGKGTNVRHVCNILPETDTGADSLLVVEVITPGGHTSSYPPHKHDEDNLPHESLLEETYYHRIDPPQGFAFQRVYTDDRSLDETMLIEDGSITLVPRGYHPCAAIHGYDLYYLNVMAGPRRIWKFHNAREHEWLLKT